MYGIWTAREVGPVARQNADQLQQAPVSFSDPLVFKPLIHWLHPTMPADHDLQLNPLLLAAWVGMLITGLNMMPISQLDGGHVAYALLRPPRRSARAAGAAGGRRVYPGQRPILVDDHAGPGRVHRPE